MWMFGKTRNIKLALREWMCLRVMTEQTGLYSFCTQHSSTWITLYRSNTSLRQRKWLPPCPLSLPWCPWNAAVDIKNFLIGCPLPRWKCVSALALSQTKHIQTCLYSLWTNMNAWHQQHFLNMHKKAWWIDITHHWQRQQNQLCRK